MTVLTKTNLQDFMSCPYYYKLNQIDGLFYKSQSLIVSIGTLFHSAMEIWGKHGKEDALGFISQAVKQCFNDNKLNAEFKPQDLEKVSATIHGMVNGYPYPVQADGCEVEFMVDFYGFKLAGKWDGDYKDAGRSVLFDYKTKGRLPKLDHGLLKRDLQGQLYFHVARQLGMDVEGFEQILVKRSELRQGKKESWPAYLQRIRMDYVDPKRVDDNYARHAVLYDPDGEEFWANLRMVTDNVQRCMGTKRWPQHTINCKTRWHKHCVYLPVCNKELGWEELYDVMGPDHHPELSYGREYENGE